MEKLIIRAVDAALPIIISLTFNLPGNTKMAQNNLQRVNVHFLMERFKSKKELHTFLLQDCHAFLPKLESTNVYFLRDIIYGRKEVSHIATDRSAVHQEERGQGVAGAAARRPHRRGLPAARSREALPEALPARGEG